MRTNQILIKFTVLNIDILVTVMEKIRREDEEHLFHKVLFPYSRFLGFEGDIKEISRGARLLVLLKLLSLHVH